MAFNLVALLVILIIATVGVVTTAHYVRQKRKRVQQSHSNMSRPNREPNNDTTNPRPPIPQYFREFPDWLSNAHENADAEVDIISLDTDGSFNGAQLPEAHLPELPRHRNGSIRSTSSISSSRSLSCPLCLDRFSCDRIQEEGIRITLCGHMYCKKCLVQWVGENGSCPADRRDITLEQIHPVYFQF